MKQEALQAIEAIQQMIQYEREIEANIENKTVTPFQEGFKSGLSWCRTLIKLDDTIKNMPDKKDRRSNKIKRRRFI